MAGKEKRIGDRLVESKLVSREALESTLLKYEKYEAENPQMKHKSVGEALAAEGLITESVFLAFLAKQLELEYFNNLTQVKINDEIVEYIPRNVAEESNVIALYKDYNENVVVAINDPFDIHAQERVRECITDNIVFAIASENDIKNAIKYHYAHIETQSGAKNLGNVADEMYGGTEIGNIFINDSAGDDDNPVVSFLNKLLEYGYSRKASDIHIEPFRDETVVRIRVNGMLSPYIVLREIVHRALVARIKVLSSLDISERRLPQDGHFDYVDKISGKLLFSVRVSVCPCVFGEKAVLRYLSINTEIVNDETFGMNLNNYTKVRRMLDTPHGIIYVTGATGSGKTTTLYKMLDYLANKQISIASIEDPVERNVDKVSQMQVNVAAGLTFEKGLRAILRQDPDVFMVGETRDKETASISIRAAITGHLVLSSLHTNDSVSSLTRLVDMEIPRYMLSASLVGIIAQRLVRVVCDECAREVPVFDYEHDTSFLPPYIKVIRKGMGCPACSNSGYKGRQAVHEVMVIDNKIRRMINDVSVDTADIKDYCKQTLGMKTLEEEIFQLIYEGVTTPEEYMRVTSTIGIE